MSLLDSLCLVELVIMDAKERLLMCIGVRWELGNRHKQWVLIAGFQTAR